MLRLMVAVAGLLPALALAHPGHGETSSFMAGAIHPLSDAGHMFWFVAVGVLAHLLGRRYAWPAAAAFLGVLISAWTNENDGWQYVAGFMASSAVLIAAGAGAGAGMGIRIVKPLELHRPTLTGFYSR
jgi:urease accessory protein